MARNIADLHPRLQEQVYKLINLCKQKGLVIGISECVRTVQEQDDLYAQGRTKPGNIVTNAKGSSYSSMHQWGVAFDFYRNDGKGVYNNSDGFFNKIGAVGKSIGLEWGGDWLSPVDLPHFQLPDRGSTAAKLKQLYKTPEKFKESWDVDDMTEEKVEEIVNKKINEALKDNKYNWTTACPKWSIPTVQKLLDKGYLVGNDKGELELTDNSLKILTIIGRTGVYDIDLHEVDKKLNEIDNKLNEIMQLLGK